MSVNWRVTFPSSLCVSVLSCVCTTLYIYIHTHTYIYIICMCVCMYVCAYVCIYVCMYVHRTLKKRERIAYITPVHKLFNIHTHSLSVLHAHTRTHTHTHTHTHSSQTFLGSGVMRVHTRHISTLIFSVSFLACVTPAHTSPGVTSILSLSLSLFWERSNLAWEFAQKECIPRWRSWPTNFNNIQY